LPRIVFDWVEEFHCYIHDVAAILLRSASMAEDMRFKKFPLLTSKDLQQGEEFDEKHYLMAGAADELTGAELKQAVLEFDADFEHVKFVAAGSLGHLPPVKEEWADFPAQAWQTCTGRSPHLQSCQQIPKGQSSNPAARTMADVQGFSTVQDDLPEGWIDDGSSRSEAWYEEQRLKRATRTSPAARTMADVQGFPTVQDELPEGWIDDGSVRSEAWYSEQRLKRATRTSAKPSRAPQPLSTVSADPQGPKQQSRHDD